VKTRRKSFYPAIRFAAFVATALLFALNAREVANALSAQPLELLILLAFFSLLLALGVPLASFPQFGRREPADGRIAFDLTVFALTFAVYGWVVTGLLSFLASAFAFGTGRQFSVRERMLIASTRVPFWAVAGWAAARLHPNFFVFNSIWAVAFVLIYKERLQLRDPVLWSVVAAQILWAFIATLVFERAGSALGLATLLPLPLFALTLRALHRERLSSHRKSLARDAVWNMLQARDPAAQINSFLESVHGDAPLETLQIYARLRSESRPAPLASVGPWPGDDRFALVRRAILELHAHDKESVTVRDDRGSVTAYGIRSGRLLGSLIVHRPAGVTARLAQRRYLVVANELAPLLRDVRSVVAARDAAQIDSLTGLLNRATIVSLLREHLARVGPETGCAILILDVDRFKEVNDTMGHLEGDRCLRTVAETIAENIRPGDRAGRIGGEEFVVLMPLGAEPAAAAAGERLRVAIERCGAMHADGTPITASIGVAVATIADSAESLLQRADRALYQAKNAGRNRVVEIA
jgi:diguanylate cyclase (GGDEF)-like protein